MHRYGASLGVADVPFLSIFGSAFVIDPDAHLCVIATATGGTISESQSNAAARADN